ncbi:MAG TPA: type II secretion system protein GspL [Piscinibacter sp.]|nr:type II secretion system protein GspL [Piscinibacter sp.]HNM82341.1 type II secretion system protein GspL [Rhodocyclaceae bacterium]
MTRLLLAIDEQWPGRPGCPWVLLGPDGSLLSEGHSEPRHWPAAAKCEVLLTGPQCLWLKVALPRGVRRDLPRLMAYALEDRLLKDSETQQLTLSHRRPLAEGERDQAGVLVVARDRLRQISAQLAALGRPPQRVLSELQTAPAGTDGWHLSIGAEGAVLRTHADAGLALDIDVLEQLLAQQAVRARAADSAPKHISLHVAPGVSAPDVVRLQQETGLPVHLTNAYHWWQAVDRKAANLLHGELAFRGGDSGWLGQFRPALAVAGAALAVWLMVQVGEVLWMKHRLNQIHERIERVYLTTFPNGPVVAPAAQMRQQLNLARTRHGLLRDDDALALLALAAEALGTQAAGGIAGLRFEEGRLNLTLAEPAAARGEAVVGLLTSRGLLADLHKDGATTHLLLRRENLP